MNGGGGYGPRQALWEPLGRTLGSAKISKLGAPAPDAANRRVYGLVRSKVFAFSICILAAACYTLSVQGMGP